MDEQDDNRNDYIDGALFAINTNYSTTTKSSLFFVMLGRQPRMPFVVEKFVTPFEEGDEAYEVNKFTGNCFRVVRIVLKITFLKLRYPGQRP